MACETTWAGRPLPPMRREAHFGDRVIACFRDRPASLSEVLEQAAGCKPEGEAIVCGGARMSWREVLDASDRLAAALRRHGIGPGARVALLVGNRPEFVLALFATARLGAIVVPLSTRLQTPEIAYALQDCGAEALIHEEAFAERLPPVPDTPELLHRIGLGEGGGPFMRLLEEPAIGEPPERVSEEDTAVILYTSGTTGRPKGAMLTHLNLIHSAMVYEACMGLGPADRSLAAVPLAHVTGLVANLIAMARCAGTLVILPAFKAGDYLALAARERITQTIIVPTMYELCLRHPDFDRFDLSAWRIGGYGGAPMPVATIGRLAAKLPNLRLMNAYGATETTSPTTIMPPELTAGKGDSVGLAAPGARVISVDEAGREVEPGEIGEIWIQGPSVVKGYWNRPDATTDSFTGGFWRSGDLGCVDADGFVFVRDRKKDMINRAGLKVYTAEVEAVLAQHADVQESAVVAKPCPVLGERVHAFAVVREGGTDAEALRRFCAARLSDYKVPESFTFLTEPLPRNANGKVMKQVLREEMARSVGGA